MNIIKNKNGNMMTLQIEGRLDTTTAPLFEKEITLLEADVTDLLIDMSALAYISSAGLRVLLGAQKKMNRIGTMRLTGVSETIMDVFEMTGFADILNIES